ncbi:MAG TPA: hypothetical protein DD624_07985 [Alphaproteobacteria bacterium]|nr:hypothetical protein [Alphaproteobacteria bacterium]
MNDVFPSSETYDLDPRDLAGLPDAETMPVKFDASVVVLLGDERKGVSDALLKGRSAVETAVARKTPFIPVQIAFRRRTAWFDVLSPFCKAFRRRFISYGTHTHEGHHRMLVCLSFDIPRVAVKFCAASHAPHFLTPLLKPLCAAVQFFKKRNFRKAEQENENYFERKNNA